MGRLSRVTTIADVSPARLAEGLNGMSDLVRHACDEATDVDELKTLIKSLAAAKED